MATVVVELRNEPNKQGLYPLALRITINRKPTYRRLGINISMDDWDYKNRLVKSSHPNANQLNILIAENIFKARRRLNSKISKGSDSNIFKTKMKVPKQTFFDFAQEQLRLLEASKKFQRLSVEKAHFGYIKKFSKTEQLFFTDIDEHFLMRLKDYLRIKHNLSETSILNVLVFIRTMYNRAIKQKIAKRNHYPFGSDKIKIKFPESKKIGLNKWEVLLLEQLKDLTEGEVHARNVWMYSFNLAGIRVSDVLKVRWSDFHDGRLYYRMGKNSKLVSLKTPSKVLDILEYYRATKKHANDFVFPEMKVVNLDDPKDLYTKIKTANKKLNYHLKKIAKKAGIDKPLTMHIARHSFGNIAGDTIHPTKLQKLYRHTSLQTTINYQASFIHTEVDEALDSVVNF
ncbi:site-specific integrase [Flavobacteriaceae bacterium 3-367]